VNDHTKCRTCGRTFARKPEKLALEKQYCRRATMYGSYCDDKRCEAQRRIVPANKVKVSFKVKHHCTEDRIKAVEKGYRDS
jgi:hypothetical protein